MDVNESLKSFNVFKDNSSEFLIPVIQIKHT